MGDKNEALLKLMDNVMPDTVIAPLRRAVWAAVTAAYEEGRKSVIGTAPPKGDEAKTPEMVCSTCGEMYQSLGERVHWEVYFDGCVGRCHNCGREARLYPMERKAANERGENNPPEAEAD